MKKHDLITGILYLTLGIMSLITVLFFDTDLEFLAMFGIVGGIRLLHTWRYWHKPENRERGREYAAMEEMENRDEMKTMLRDKAGRCAHLVMTYGTCITAFILIFLDQLRIAETDDFIFLLGAYLCIQTAAEAIAYRVLLNKYSE